MKHIATFTFITVFLLFVTSITFAQQTSDNRLIMSMSESEVNELDLSRELLFQSRAEFEITSESDKSDLLANLTTRLNDIGWSSGWQKDIDEKHVADFFALGGANLRLELSETTANTFRLLLYRY